ncbi:MAG: hypothetical protein M3Y07_00770 [Acidobacteriota bacterium]|nr:hypothetical protein [Acidobacteriota bacterium]
MLRWLLLALLPASLTAANPELDRTFNQLYNCDYADAHSTIDRYTGQHPEDPVGFAVKAATYLYSELDQLGVLESDFFESDARIGDKKKLKPDPRAKEEFERASAKSESLATADLARDPNDRNALFAMSLSVGERADYMALIEKRQLASLSVNKQAYRYAHRLIQLDPKFYDAYLTTGFTEYVIGDLPAVIRWFVKFDDVQGDKAAAIRTLKLVADKGNYLKPLAQIFLAAANLRDKNFGATQKLLQGLTRDFPGNPLLRRELIKITAKVH